MCSAECVHQVGDISVVVLVIHSVPWIVRGASAGVLRREQPPPARESVGEPELCLYRQTIYQNRPIRHTQRQMACEITSGSRSSCPSMISTPYS